MKIPQLVVQYLYNNRKISLPGLGIFTLDKSVVLPDENDRTLHAIPNAVQFQNANIASAEKELISYICEHTGKIRPLAISDLDSYLNLGTEMLNIGKPFHLEGIGIITKNKTGKFDFTPGEYTLNKEKTSSSDHVKKRDYVKDLKQLNMPTGSQNRNLLKVLAMVAAITIIGWGSWFIYKKNSLASSEQITDTNSNLQQSQQALADSLVRDSVMRETAKQKIIDSQVIKANGISPYNYKFIILATDNKPYALKRFNQLSSFNLKVHFYQKDSSYFKIYFQFPAMAKDTIHIKDSLRKEYAHQVIIEQ